MYIPSEKYENMDIFEYEDWNDVYIRFVGKGIGLIGKKDLIKFILSEIHESNMYTIKLADLREDGCPYFICITHDGNVFAEPADSLFYIDDAKEIYCIDRIMIDMDGSVKQYFIDDALDTDLDVILFGRKDPYEDKIGSTAYEFAGEWVEHNCDCRNHVCSCNRDNELHGFTITRTCSDESWSSVSYRSTDEVNLSASEIAEIANKLYD